MDGREIVKMLWDRKEEAISRMETSYGDLCYHISFNIVKNNEDASECVNDTWLNTWNSIPVNRPDSLRAYVAKIARNLSLNCLWRDRAWKRGRGEVFAVYEEMEEMLGEDDPIDHMIDRQVFTEIMNTFLSMLDREERDIFVLRFWYFESPAKIAKRFGRNEKAIYNTLYRLKKQFKAFWKRETE